MRFVLCLKCEDVRGLDPKGQPVTCRCGNTQGFLEGEILHLRAVDRGAVRILGIHRQAMRYAADPSSARNGQSAWQMQHEHCVGSAVGYVYHRNNRACWMAIMLPEEVLNTVWDDAAPEVAPMLVAEPPKKRRSRRKTIDVPSEGVVLVGAVDG